MINIIPISEYITGERISSLCNIQFNPVSLHDLPKSGIIYCKIDDVPLFLECSKNGRYVLVTHNGDREITDAMAENSPQVMTWFGQNASTKHPKVHGIPIGFANSRWAHGNLDLVYSTSISYKPIVNTCYLNAKISTAKLERWSLYEKTKNESWITKKCGIGFQEYIDDIKTHSFILSPRGKGIDCHRTWEALYLGNTPVILNSVAMSHFKCLPIIFLDSWEELSLEKLLSKHKEVKNNSNEKLYLSYWKKALIEESKKL